MAFNVSWKSALKLLAPVIVGYVGTNVDTLSTTVLPLISGSPRLSVFVGSVIVAIAYAWKSPVVQHEIAKLNPTPPAP